MTTKQIPQTALLNLLSTKIEVFNKLAIEINELAKQANLPLHIDAVSEEIVSEAQSQEESIVEEIDISVLRVKSIKGQYHLTQTEKRAIKLGVAQNLREWKVNRKEVKLTSISMAEASGIVGMWESGDLGKYFDSQKFTIQFI